MPTLDFAVRNLAEYSSNELTELALALSFAKAEFKKIGAEPVSLDFWGYRIMEAQKESMKREEQETFLGI